jgi:hypothetical protein
MNIVGLRELVKKRFKLRAHFSVQSEVCLIGVGAYFEAFCGASSGESVGNLNGQRWV